MEEKKKNSLTIEEASNLMGKSKQFVREGLKRKTLPFGSAVVMPGGRYSYYISAIKYEEFTGIEIK